MRLDELMGFLYEKVCQAALFVRYGMNRRFQIKVRGVSVRYSTADAYSRRWFYPRYAGGKIHEEKVTRLMADHMLSSRCFVDVGAHIGFYTCLAARLMPDRIVYAFEMNSHFHELLVRNVALNKGHNVHAFCAAVADASRAASYAKQPKSRYRPTLSLTTGMPASDHVAQVIVQAVSLDSFFEDKEPKPDLVKIDVEGAEMMVLAGMRELLSAKAPRLFVEVHPQKLADFGSSAAAVLSTLIDHGYEVNEIEEMRSSGDQTRLRILDRTSPISRNTMLFARRRPSA